MKKILTAILISKSIISFAAHLVGGEISYQCIGSNTIGNTYEINLTVYRDCSSLGAGFDASAPIAIYRGPNQNILFTTLNVARGPITQLPLHPDNFCLQPPPNVCTEKTSYTANASLPYDTNGYTIVYQRCCLNNTITNISNPGTWGNTYSIRIPAQDTLCNSSARFNQDPPIVMCKDDSLHLDFSAQELDGDSIFYSFCQPLNGGSQNNPAPVIPSAPPFTPVPFLSPYSFTYPMPATPNLSINPVTGILTGTPSGIGQFFFAICAEEYDSNGVLLSNMKRDYQFNIVNYSLVPDSIQAQPQSNTFYTIPGNAHFSVVHSDSSATFQWQQNNGTGWTSLSNFGIYSGTTTDSLVLTGVTTSLNASVYRCVIDACSTIDTTDLATLTVIDNMNVSEVLESIVISPNPTSGILNVNLTSLAEYELFNFNGQRVAQGKTEGQIDITNLPTGIYQIIITYDNVHSTHTIQKM